MSPNRSIRLLRGESDGGGMNWCPMSFIEFPNFKAFRPLDAGLSFPRFFMLRGLLNQFPVSSSSCSLNLFAILSLSLFFPCSPTLEGASISRSSREAGLSSLFCNSRGPRRMRTGSDTESQKGPDMTLCEPKAEGSAGMSNTKATSSQSCETLSEDEQG